MRTALALLLAGLLVAPGFATADPEAVVVSSDDVGALLPEQAGPTSTHPLFAATDAHARFTVDTCGGYGTEPTASVWYAAWGNENAPDWWTESDGGSTATSADGAQGFRLLEAAIVGDAFGWGRCCACNSTHNWCIVYARDSETCCCKMVMEPDFTSSYCKCKAGSC